MTLSSHGPGTLIRARGREWIVLSGSDAETLRVRPLSGSEEDQTLIDLLLETEPVTLASFPPPHPSQRGGHEAALLLRDALLLSLRRGAGPFRAFGQIAVEPRAYQLVPLLLALKQDPVRLLIADDVGIGKTIEAGLIARELWDRGEIHRFTVLCPPHLVDQWVSELLERFHLRAVPVTAAAAARLEKNLPPSVSVFSAHPVTVVSLDYIKSEGRRAEFLRACPEFVIVDEAHTCTATGKGRHQRYELLKGLSENPTRHLVMLTATPHSGDEAAFYRLLGLLDPRLAGLVDATAETRTELRELLSKHFVQRRRPDIAEWQEGKLFPRRETKELTYRLTGEWDRFMGAVLDYCAEIVANAEGDEQRKRLSFWGTLALMRCVSSSPAAALSALRTRAGISTDEEEEDAMETRIFDGRGDNLPDDDIEPPAANGDPALEKLMATAEKLAGLSSDPKLKLLTDHLEALCADGFSPVVFCRYIATANYLGSHLEGRFPGVTLGVITGEFTSDERKEKVALLGEAEKSLLIATDCLSEGINLQAYFDAVVHYDLSWNPTRHEQREGRVDRFGQEREVVRATLIYGANNPVDATVLEVILRKAQKIREELGVPVPLPDEGHTLTQALLRTVFMRHRKQGRQQLFLDFGEVAEAAAVDAVWQDAADKAKRNRTVFAQRRIKPEEVLPEWGKSLMAIGDKKDVRRFTERAMQRLGAGLIPLRRGFKAPLGSLPEDVRERLYSEGLSGSVLVDFEMPPAPRCRPIQRCHPLVSVLAETLLSRTLGQAEGEVSTEAGVLGRAGVWNVAGIKKRTTILLLRLRHQLVTQRAGVSSMVLVEEATGLGFVGSNPVEVLDAPEALRLLSLSPTGEPAEQGKARLLASGREMVLQQEAEISAFALRRAETLLADHRRVREASGARGSYSVKALLPADVIGFFVLVPEMD